MVRLAKKILWWRLRPQLFTSRSHLERNSRESDYNGRLWLDGWMEEWELPWHPILRE